MLLVIDPKLMVLDLQSRAVIDIRSPFSRYVRCWPSSRFSGSLPFHDNSSMQPQLERSGPLMVPLARMSPARTGQPLVVW